MILLISNNTVHYRSLSFLTFSSCAFVDFTTKPASVANSCSNKASYLLTVTNGGYCLTKNIISEMKNGRCAAKNKWGEIPSDR